MSQQLCTLVLDGDTLARQFDSSLFEKWTKSTLPTYIAIGAKVHLAPSLLIKGCILF